MSFPSKSSPALRSSVSIDKDGNSNLGLKLIMSSRKLVMHGVKEWSMTHTRHDLVERRSINLLECTELAVFLFVVLSEVATAVAGY